MFVFQLTSYGVALHFRTGGGFKDYLGRNDGRKRAVTCPINCFHASAQVLNQKFFLAASTIGSEFDYSNPQQPTIRIKPLLEYQAGIRPGMSGGGAFLGEDYVGIPSRFGLGTNFSLAKKLKLKAERKLKYLAALGITVPFMHNYLGDKESVIMLGVHEEWIRQSRVADIIGQYITPTPMSHYVKCAVVYTAMGLMLCKTLSYFGIF